jgi:ParB/RepB/Spo0J family partition protein
MNAIATPTLLPRGDLIPSPTNPRKRKGLDAASLAELAQTMRPPLGILSPIRVRHLVQDGETTGLSFILANEGKYEIIAGERRWRAALIAGLTEVPVIVRQLNDLEVLKIQLIENKQREDLDELEEAEGYEKLMQQVDANGNPYTADTIADAMGVSRSTIYARLKLLDLCQEARDSFYAGELDASTALLLARIPVKKLQIEALAEVTRKMTYQTGNVVEGEKALSYRKAREILQDRYMLDLAEAPFDIKDSALIPKAGSCTGCTKRTGNQPELFDDVTSKDICTDPVCHAMKKTAHVLAIQKSAEEKGYQVILAKDAKKVLPNDWQKPKDQLEKHGYATLDTVVPGDTEGRTYAKLLKEKNLLKSTGSTPAPLAKTLIENPHKPGSMIETVNIEAVTKALREAGYEITPVQKVKENTANDAHKKQMEKQRADNKQNEFARKRLFDTLHQKIDSNLNNPNPVMQDGLYRILAEHFFAELVEFGSYDGEEASMIAKMYMPDLPEEVDLLPAFQDEIPKLSTQQHVLLLIDLAMINELESNNVKDNLYAIAQEIGVDADTIEKEALAEAKAADKAAAAAAKKAEKEKEAAKVAKATKKDAKPKATKKIEPEVAPAPKVRPAATWPFPTPITNGEEA